jgi:hypothetical protein
MLHLHRNIEGRNIEGRNIEGRNIDYFSPCSVSFVLIGEYIQYISV